MAMMAISEGAARQVDAQISSLGANNLTIRPGACLLYTSDAADERSSVDLGGRRIIKKKNNMHRRCMTMWFKIELYTRQYIVQANVERQEG